MGDLQHEMATIRTGRASLSLPDHIRVDYYVTFPQDLSFYTSLTSWSAVSWQSRRIL